MLGVNDTCARRCTAWSGVALELRGGSGSVCRAGRRLWGRHPSRRAARQWASGSEPCTVGTGGSEALCGRRWPSVL